MSTAGPVIASGFAHAGGVGVYGFNASDQTQTVRVRTSDGSLASVHQVGPPLIGPPADHRARLCGPLLLRRAPRFPGGALGQGLRT